MKKLLVCILAIIFCTSLCGCVCETPQMSEDYYAFLADNASFEKIETTEKIGRIEFYDNYTMDGIKYFEIKTSLTGEKIFTYSEEEFNKVFGEGNDAFKTKVYKYENKVSFAEKQPGLYLPKSELGTYFRCVPYTNIPYKKASVNSYSTEAKIIDGLWPYLMCEKRFGRAEAIITVERFKFLNQNDFTEEEINIYRNEMISMCEDFFEYLKENNYQTSLDWKVQWPLPMP